MLLVALTGGIGCGKTYVTKIFEKLKIPIIYADNIAKDLLYNDKNIGNQVKQYFNIADVQKNIKNIKINIFSNKKHRLFLEKLIHPKVVEHIVLQIRNLAIDIHKSNNYCIIEIPMLLNLLEILSKIKIDKIILINCYPDLQISRVMQRDKLTRSQVVSILRSQLAVKKINNVADYILDGSKLKNIEQEIINLDQKLRHRSC